MHFKYSILLLAFFSLVTACKDDNMPVPIDPGEVFEPGTGKYLISEGLFQHGNSSIDFINMETFTIHRNVYFKQNEQAIGDILQSMYIHDETAYLVVNNSGKIIVTDASNLAFKGKINGLTSPRYFLPVSEREAWVTASFSGNIAVIDMLDMEIIGEIEIGAWTEQMVKQGDEVFVAVAGGSEVLVINATTRTISSRIQVGTGPVELDFDLDGNLWLMYQGDYSLGTTGGLMKIDPSSKEVLQEFPFASNDGVSARMVLNPLRTHIYYLNGDVFLMDREATSLPEEPIKRANGALYYAPDMDKGGHVLISDAVDFTTASTFELRMADGSPYGIGTTGINCNSFVAY